MSDLAALRQDVKALRASVGLLTRKIITCGVAASHPDAALAASGAYATEWDSPQAQSVRELRADRDALRAALRQQAEQLKHLASAMRKLLPPELLAEVADCLGAHKNAVLTTLRADHDALRQRIATLEQALREAQRTGCCDAHPPPYESCPCCEAVHQQELRQQAEAQVATLEQERDWQPIETAPRNATWFIGLLGDGEVRRVHWAEDLSGEEQPPFRGFFYKNYSSFVGCSPTHWMPLPAAPGAQVADLSARLEQEKL